MRTFLLLMVITLIGSCSNQEPINPKGQLVHTVILKLKEEVSDEQRNFALEQLKSLGTIAETKNLLVARYTQTPDKRAKTDYDFILEMQFENKSDLASYSQNEFHLSIREKLKPLLAGPPMVYDYLIE